MMNANWDTSNATAAAGVGKNANANPSRRSSASGLASAGNALLLRRNNTFTGSSGGGFGMPSLRRNSSKGGASAAAAFASGGSLHASSIAEFTSPKPKKRNSLTSLSSLLAGKPKLSSRRGSGHNFEQSATSSESGCKTYSVYDLLERRKWKRLLKFLDTPEGREQVRASISKEEPLVDEDKDQSDMNSDGTVLHHAILQDAPLEIVRALSVAGGPTLWPVADSGGRTALHAAASVVNRDESHDAVIYLLGLLTGTKSAIAAKDADGRTALHLACMERPPRRILGLSNHHDGDSDGVIQVKSRKISPSVVRALADAAPAAIQIVDECGLTPLDYAVMTVTDLDGNFRPASKPSARILSEVAIFPMIRHCHALWSTKRATATGNDEEEENDFSIEQRAEWTKRRSSAVRSAMHACKTPESKNARQHQRRRRSEGARTLDESLHHHLLTGGAVGGGSGSRCRSETRAAASPAGESASSNQACNNFGTEAQLVMRVQDFRVENSTSGLCEPLEKAEQI